eukprot:CFRG1748T1
MNSLDVIRSTKIDKAYLYISASPIKHTGSVHFTARHLLFASADRQKEIWLLLQTLSSVERKPITTRGTPIVLRTKTFRLCTLLIPNEKESNDLYDALMGLGFPRSVDQLYAFDYQYKQIAKSEAPTWEFYDATAEYDRMGVPNTKWRRTGLNRRFGLCATYPRELYVPAGCSDEMLTECAAFRSRQRLPILSYLYSKNQSSLTRCSQPKVGIQSKRSTADETVVQTIFSANPNPVSKHYIIDARPKVNAMAQRANGAGYESTAFYLNCKYLCMNIENIHVIRESLNKLVDVCHIHNATTSQWLSGIYSSGWLSHIKTILNATCLMTRAMDVEGASIVLHCSDGWDRTAQLSSLTQLCLDPYYRTIKGFISLICKEWIQFGHKFNERNGFWGFDKKEFSPVFTQFLDCVWQMIRQFPYKFEYTSHLLIDIHEELHACRFGTFLGDCQKERLNGTYSQKTPSLWWYIMDNVHKYVNPIYEGMTSSEQDVEGVSVSANAASDVLYPETAPQHIHVFRPMYCQYVAGKMATSIKDTFALDVKREMSGVVYNERRAYILDKLKELAKKNPSKAALLNISEFEEKSMLKNQVAYST